MSASGLTVEPAVPEQSLLGESAAMRSVRAQVAKISLTPSNVLITGESGTGKEIVARAIHTASSRHTQAFVPINCGAIPEALLESQLFGHVRGAFTTAVQASPGLFAAADRGTIYLDEIGGGRFREDLFYRLNVVHIALPPLRERREDMGLLVEHFVRALNLKLSTKFLGVDREVLS